MPGSKHSRHRFSIVCQQARECLPDSRSNQVFQPSLKSRLIGMLVLFPMLISAVVRAEDNKSASNQIEQKFAALKPLNKTETVFLDAAGKKLVLKGEVALREGLLEMLVCLKRSKEHESILSVETQAQIVHAGLLALGCQAGSPVRWEPEFRAPTGPQIDIFFSWVDPEGKLHRDAAQTWVRHATRKYYVEKLANLPNDFRLPADSELKWDAKHKEILWYGHMSEAQRDAALAVSKDKAYQSAIQSFFKKSQIRQMEGHWVFAGSYFLTDEKSGEKFYQAESGDLICVANFATATIDISAVSSASNDDLMFEAFTERIPPVGTKIMIELVPQLKPANETKASAR